MEYRVIDRLIAYLVTQLYRLLSIFERTETPDLHHSSILSEFSFVSILCQSDLIILNITVIY